MRLSVFSSGLGLGAVTGGVAQSLVVSRLLSAMRISTFIIAAIALMFIGCACHHDAIAHTRAESFRASVGQRVSLVGIAEARKIGAARRCDGFYVWIDGLHAWPAGYVDERVEVVGVREERHDLPVFVQRPGDLPVQGIPVQRANEPTLCRERRKIEFVTMTWPNQNCFQLASRTVRIICQRLFLFGVGFER